MKSCILVLLNNVFYRELEILYGKNSFVDVISVKFCTTTKKFLVDVKLYLTDIDSFTESGIESLSYLVSEAWKYTGYNPDEVTVLSSYELSENYSSS
jgi:hypothetical protein